MKEQEAKNLKKGTKLILLEDNFDYKAGEEAEFVEWGGFSSVNVMIRGKLTIGLPPSKVKLAESSSPETPQEIDWANLEKGTKLEFIKGSVNVRVGDTAYFQRTLGIQNLVSVLIDGKEKKYFKRRFKLAEPTLQPMSEAEFKSLKEGDVVRSLEGGKEVTVETTLTENHIGILIGNSRYYVPREDLAASEGYTEEGVTVIPSGYEVTVSSPEMVASIRDAGSNSSQTILDIAKSLKKTDYSNFHIKADSSKLSESFAKAEEKLQRFARDINASLVSVMFPKKSLEEYSRLFKKEKKMIEGNEVYGPENQSKMVRFAKWLVAPPVALAKGVKWTFKKSNWILWSGIVAAGGYVGWLVSSGVIELQSPFKF